MTGYFPACLMILLRPNSVCISAGEVMVYAKTDEELRCGVAVITLCIVEHTIDVTCGLGFLPETTGYFFCLFDDITKT